VKLLLHLLILVTLSGLTAAAVLSHLPPEKTVPMPASDPETPPRDLLDLLGQAAIKRSGMLEITEAELNRYLAETFQGAQAGRTGGYLAFDRVAVDIEPQGARVMLFWKNKQAHLTMASLDLTLGRTEDGKNFRVEIQRGAYGRLPVDRGFLLPVLPAFETLAAACEREITALFQMTKIDFAKDKLVLDSRF
jgi:hypothetical protein